MAHSREVWRIDRAGSLDRLTRRPDLLPDPGPGEARVVVHAVGLNFADVFACQGLYSATPRGPFVPGLEFAGTVDALGAGGGPLRVGDRVFGLIRFGAYATAVNIDVRYLHPLPGDWTFAEGAGYAVQGLTAWYGLVRLGALARGACALVHSAAGGVGLNALGIANAVGADVVATVGHPAKRDWLVEHRGLAAERVVVRDRRRFGAQLDHALAAAGRPGFDLVFDAVAGPFFRPAYERLRPEGRLVLYGAADFMQPRARPEYARLMLRYLRRPRLDPLEMIAENRGVLAFNLIWLWEKADRLPHAYDELRRVVPGPPPVGRTFPFAEAPAAMRHLQSGLSIGKVVLEV
jgi:alcohol dehydrogenase